MQQQVEILKSQLTTQFTVWNADFWEILPGAMPRASREASSTSNGLPPQMSRC